MTTDDFQVTNRFLALTSVEVELERQNGVGGGKDRLLKNVSDALAATDRYQLTSGLVQVAAAAVAWIEKLMLEAEKLDYRKDGDADEKVYGALSESEKANLGAELIRLASVKILKNYDLMTTPEVAEAFRVSPSQVRRWIKSGHLPTVTTPSGGQYRIKRADVAKLLDRP
jgi:excisionase family DNA binding protein